MSITLTPEQFDVKEHLLSLDGMVLVSAKAGTGKSFLSRALVHFLKPKSVLYTAFNKAIVLEAAGKFDSSAVECKTFHALAYKYTKPNKDIRTTNYRDFPKNISYDVKYKVLQSLEAFYVSASTDIDSFFENFFEGEDNKESLISLAISTIGRMLDRKLPWSFGFMLKYFHLLIVENPDLIKYDLVILDEINDTTAVALEIFKLIKAPKKLGLGEPYQAIYAFMNLVNGFEELEGVPVYPLTHSFRCSKEIASGIECFMQEDLCSDFKFVGTDTPVANGETLYCTLSNASIVKELVFRLQRNKSFKLLRDPKDIFACCLAVLSASSGKEVYQKQYKYLQDIHKDWKQDNKGHAWFFSYLTSEIKDEEIRSAVQLLNVLRLENINIFDVYSKVKNQRQGGDYTIATVYTAKGLEFETVVLADEFDYVIEKIKDNGGIRTPEDVVLYRCYYVAASRAGKVLENAKMLRMG